METLKVHKELNPSNKHMNEFGSESFYSPVKSSDDTTALTNTLIAALWENLEVEAPS